mgnify:CR=1 FL=1
MRILCSQLGNGLRLFDLVNSLVLVQGLLGGLKFSGSFIVHSSGGGLECWKGISQVVWVFIGFSVVHHVPVDLGNFIIESFILHSGTGDISLKVEHFLNFFGKGVNILGLVIGVGLSKNFTGLMRDLVLGILNANSS